MSNVTSYFSLQTLTDRAVRRVSELVRWADFDHVALCYLGMRLAELRELTYPGQSNVSYIRDVLTAWRNKNQDIDCRKVRLGRCSIQRFILSIT